MILIAWKLHSDLRYLLLISVQAYFFSCWNLRSSVLLLKKYRPHSMKFNNQAVPERNRATWRRSDCKNRLQEQMVIHEWTIWASNFSASAALIESRKVSKLNYYPAFPLRSCRAINLDTTSTATKKCITCVLQTKWSYQKLLGYVTVGEIHFSRPALYVLG